jgi:hypothetical protein
MECGEDLHSWLGTFVMVVILRCGLLYQVEDPRPTCRRSLVVCTYAA